MYLLACILSCYLIFVVIKLNQDINDFISEADKIINNQKIDTICKPKDWTIAEFGNKSDFHYGAMRRLIVSLSVKGLETFDNIQHINSYIEYANKMFQNKELRVEMYGDDRVCTGEGTDIPFQKEYKISKINVDKNYRFNLNRERIVDVCVGLILELEE